MWYCLAQPQALENIPDVLSNIAINADLSETNQFLFFTPYYNEGYVVVLNTENEVVFYKEVGNYGARDFKLHENGLMSYFSGESEHFIILDKQFDVVDSVECKNDLITDFHDFSILPNGNYCLLCKGTAVKDFSNLGGSQQHLAVNPVIQILDSLHQIVFEWELAQHFDGEYVIPPLDNFSPNGNLKNYIHLNSFDVDSLGNFLISSRFQSQISYVDKQSGDILWRLGGPQNEFTFTNDVGFSDQHSARWTGEHTILLFDNGCFDEKKYSRAVEYELDFENKTASKIWEFVRPDSLHTGSLGNCQRLPNGNTLTSWGDAGLQPLNILEISPEGEVVFDLSMDSLIYTYSAYKFTWPLVDSTETFIATTKGTLFEMFPNPSSQNFHLTIDNFSGHNEIIISNIYGLQLYQSEIHQIKSKHLHDLEKGLYMVNLYSGKLLKGTQKLIVK